MPGPPRKLICVLGEASGVPGSGETATGFDAATPADASLESTAEPTGEVLPQPASRSAQAIAAAMRRSQPAGACIRFRLMCACRAARPARETARTGRIPAASPYARRLGAEPRRSRSGSPAAAAALEVLPAAARSRTLEGDDRCLEHALAQLRRSRSRAAAERPRCGARRGWQRRPRPKPTCVPTSSSCRSPDPISPPRKTRRSPKCSRRCGENARRRARTRRRTPNSTHMSYEVIGAIVIAAYKFDVPAALALCAHGHGPALEQRRADARKCANTPRSSRRSPAWPRRTSARTCARGAPTDSSALPASTVQFDAKFEPAWVAIGLAARRPAPL